MAQYRLLGPHYLNDMFLEEGTIVGDGTPFPWESRVEVRGEVRRTPLAPSINMEGVDEEGKAEVAKRMAKFHKGVPVDIVQVAPFDPKTGRIPGQGPQSKKSPAAVLTGKPDEVNKQDHAIL